MGKVTEKELRRLLEPEKVGSLQPVGARWAQTKATATVITKHDDGRWYYETDEAEIKIWPNRFLEVPFVGGHLIWMGLEVKTKDKHFTRARLAFSLHPYSLNWYGDGVFLPAPKDARHLQRELRKAGSEEGKDLLQVLEKLKYDPFETDREWLTARLKNPMRIHLDRWHEQVEPLGDQFFVGRRGPNYTALAKGKKDEEISWLFGVCQDFEEAQKDLLLELSAMKHLRLGEFSEEILHASVRQAMAGRTEKGDKPESVAKAALRIHNDHMVNLERRKGQRSSESYVDAMDYIGKRKRSRGHGPDA